MDYASFEGQEYVIPGAGLRVKYKTYNLDWDEADIGDEESLHEPS